MGGHKIVYWQQQPEISGNELAQYYNAHRKERKGQTVDPTKSV
jgi:hypothetical protein